jgi:hypothetical protein
MCDVLGCEGPSVENVTLRHTSPEGTTDKVVKLCKKHLSDLNGHQAYSMGCSIGAVAQLGERKAGSLEVRGSIPRSSTFKV